MTKSKFWSTVCCASLVVLSTLAAAKRLPPKPVTPVVADGIRFSAEGGGTDQYVVATDTSTDKELWRAKVFHTYIKPWLEEDIQDVFITDLKVMENALFVRDEKARCYSVDLKTHGVRRARCTAAFPRERAEQ